MTTEEYILHHAKRYQKLVAHFDGEVVKETLDSRERSNKDGGGEENANADVVVAARLRPLLEAELAAGFPQGVYCRRKTAGSIDAHDLKRPVRGPPALPTLQVRICTIHTHPPWHLLILAYHFLFSF
jgi:kinesin family member 2/24